jgi:cytochrome b involved in lipid metabolism
MTAWANSHPGGSKILLKFHDKDATKAFEAAHHSAEAYAMLKDFCIDDSNELLPVSKRNTNNKPKQAVVDYVVSKKSCLQEKIRLVYTNIWGSFVC